MTTETYYIDKTWKGNYEEDIHFDGIIEIENEVIKSVDEEWRNKFYPCKNPQEVAEHIAYNMIVNDLLLSQLDGFANFPDNFAKLSSL